MKKTSLFGFAATALVAAAMLVGCGPTLSERIAGSWVYEISREQEETEHDYAWKRVQKEIDTFGEDRSYVEEGSIIKTYFIKDEERGWDTTVMMEFKFRRVGTWKLNFDNAEDWLTIIGKEATWELGEYACPESDLAENAWNMAMGLLEEFRENDEKDWPGEHNFTITSVDENEFIYEAENETITLKRVKEQATEEVKE